MNPDIQKNFRVTSLGNAGVLVRTASCTFAVDPYFPDETGEADVSTGILETNKVDGFLISHDHWDHFDPDMVSRFALKYNSWVMGPGTVIRRLRARSPGLRLIQAEPADLQSVVLPLKEGCDGTVTVYRTPHGRIHVSFLVDVPEGRLFFDADNHDTRVLPAAAIKPLAALFLYPWKQSGWKEFIAAVQPDHWFPVHFSHKEVEDVRAGTYPHCLSGTLPQEPVVLCPGDTQSVGRN